MSKQVVWMVAVAIVVLSSISWIGVAFIRADLNIFLRIILVVVGVVALLVGIQRDLYLPFLGETVLPAHLLISSPANGNVAMVLRNVPANVKVLYWAALPSRPAVPGALGPKEAYGEYVNGGVVMSRADGTAAITLECPQSYTVNRLGFDKVLPKHVHYRYEVVGKTGIMSRVFTQPVKCAATQ